MSARGKVLWVEDMLSGHLLVDNEMVIPGGGIFRVKGVMGEFAACTGRIVPTNDKWAHTYFDGELVQLDVYEDTEWGRPSKKKKVFHPRLIDDDGDEPAKHPGDKLFEEVACEMMPKRKVLKMKVAAEVRAEIGKEISERMMIAEEKNNRCKLKEDDGKQ